MTQPNYKAFAHEVMNDVFEGNEPDGFDLQDLAKKHGVVEELVMDEPCSDECNCAMFEAEFPTRCLRLI